MYVYWKKQYTKYQIKITVLWNSSKKTSYKYMLHTFYFLHFSFSAFVFYYIKDVCFDFGNERHRDGQKNNSVLEKPI